MIVKIFKTIGPRTYFTSIFLIVFAVLFSFVLENKGAFLLEQWPSILGNIILIVAFIAMLTFLEIQHKGRKLGGVHLIAYPTTFLFLPTVFELKTIPVLEAILLILGQDVFIKTLHSKNKEKGMLDLSLIISIIVFCDILFASTFNFFQQRNQKRQRPFGFIVARLHHSFYVQWPIGNFAIRDRRSHQSSNSSQSIKVSSFIQ
jgi:hypothetical protein